MHSGGSMALPRPPADAEEPTHALFMCSTHLRVKSLQAVQNAKFRYYSNIITNNSNNFRSLFNVIHSDTRISGVITDNLAN